MHGFDEPLDRRESNSLKWNHGRRLLPPAQAAADPLPMWVADMDFRVAAPVADALRREIDQGVLGYGGTPASYLEAVVGWQERRFGWRADADWIVRTPGVISALNVAIQAFTLPGDHVLVQPPIYHHFLTDVVANGRRLALAPIPCDAQGRYWFDPERFEASIQPGTRLFMLCNPHNPTGNVWSAEDLLAMASICQKHGVLVVSDEIHQDLVFNRSARHLPFGMLDHPAAADSVVCTAPTKTFNIAGLQCANIFIPNPRLRQMFRTQLERNGNAHPNILGTAACEAAYRKGEAWVDAMLAYVRENQLHFASRIREVSLQMQVTPTDALYLAWIDCRNMGLAPSALFDFFARQARLWLDPGTKFGNAGEGFMRINLACSRSLVDEALLRLQRALTE
jgi:cystathionine beta-lyase